MRWPGPTAAGSLIASDRPVVGVAVVRRDETHPAGQIDRRERAADNFHAGDIDGR